ncbi:hypothetical protein CNY67_15005 [Desulfovibrio sp. G11]|nr:hypothetical protein CNY67_15005 [Desulfovibrio sp. G11]
MYPEPVQCSLAACCEVARCGLSGLIHCCLSRPYLSGLSALVCVIDLHLGWRFTAFSANDPASYLFSGSGILRSRE